MRRVRHPVRPYDDLSDGLKAQLETMRDEHEKLEYQVRLKWRPGAVAFWDFRSCIMR